MPHKITVAIDGHSSTGKSTLARELAKALGYIYVDSGAMYRCVTLYALRKQVIWDEGIDRDKLISELPHIQISFEYFKDEGKNHTYLNGEDVEGEIRSMHVSGFVSRIAAIPEVRSYLVALQQEMGRRKGVVMDGRDIGTVVFPDAELKIFMTADAEIRAQRRYSELKAAGQQAAFEDVLQNVKRRDEQDTNRADSPLRIADGARILDNSHLSRQEQFDMALTWSKEEIAKAG